MGKFCFFVHQNELAYFKGVIKVLPKELVDVYVGPTTERIDNFDNLSSDIKNNIGILQDDGYKIYPINPDKLWHYRGIVLSASFFWGNQTLFNWDGKRKKSMIGLFHACDGPASTTSLPASHYICAHKRQAQIYEQNKVSRDTNPELFNSLMNLPHILRNEYSYSGPYHIAEWAEKRLLPREQLQSELEEKLQCTFKKNKPIIAFLQDEFCHPRQVYDALKKLAPHCNLCIKSYSFEDVPGAYLLKDKSMAPNLLRFAADYILAGYHSGTLASSTMLGLCAIPYYTNLIYFRGWRRGTLSKYTAYCPGYFKNEHVCVDILNLINPPINLMDTESILERFYDKTWWSVYRQKLSAAQKTIFIDYDIQGAAHKTAKLLLKVFARGSFGDDAVSVSLRPEYGSLNNLHKI